MFYFNNGNKSESVTNFKNIPCLMKNIKQPIKHFKIKTDTKILNNRRARDSNPYNQDSSSII